MNNSPASPYQIRNGRDPLSNIRQTARGEQAGVRPYFERDPNNPYLTGGTSAPDVFLSNYLLRSILTLDDHFPGIVNINALAGLNHFGVRNDEHVRGMAVDLRIAGGVGALVTGGLYLAGETIIIGDRTVRVHVQDAVYENREEIIDGIILALPLQIRPAAIGIRSYINLMEYVENNDN